MNGPLKNSFLALNWNRKLVVEPNTKVWIMHQVTWFEINHLVKKSALIILKLIFPYEYRRRTCLNVVFHLVHIGKTIFSKDVPYFSLYFTNFIWFYLFENLILWLESFSKRVPVRYSWIWYNNYGIWLYSLALFYMGVL